MDTMTLYREGLDRFGAIAARVGDDDWDRPTPCSRWTVRDLVNHLVYEDRWTAALLGGETIEAVGSRFDGDLLGSEPQSAVRSAQQAARAAADEPGVLDRKVQLSYGPEIAAAYLQELAADHLIHGWDLARAIDVAHPLDDEVADVLSTWFDRDRQARYVAAGVMAPAVRGEPGDAVATLLGRCGRIAGWTPAMGVAQRFHDAVDDRDVDTAAALLAEDAVFEGTDPAPDGVRLEGRAAIRAFFEQMIAETDSPTFTVEEMLACGGDIVSRSRYGWKNPDGSDGHVRGMDLVRVRDGRITELLAYVKG